MNKLLKNILTGMGSILVVAPTQSAQLNRDDYISPSDAHAIHSDWLAVGEDMKRASEKVHSGQKEG